MVGVVGVRVVFAMTSVTIGGRIGVMVCMAGRALILCRHVGAGHGEGRTRMIERRRLPAGYRRVAVFAPVGEVASDMVGIGSRFKIRLMTGVTFPAGFGKFPARMARFARLPGMRHGQGKSKCRVVADDQRIPRQRRVAEFTIRSHAVGHMVGIPGALISQRVARAARRGQTRELVFLLILMTALAIGCRMAPDERKPSHGMIEFPRLPVGRHMAFLAVISKLSLVNVVVALITFILRYLESQGRMTGFAVGRLVQAVQREARLRIVIESHHGGYGAPLPGGMARIAGNGDLAVRIL